MSPLDQATLDVVHRVGGITIAETAYQLARVGHAPTHRALSDTLARLERGGHITSDVHPNGVTAWQGVEA